MKQYDNLSERLIAKTLQEGEFVLRSGRVSSHKIECDNIKSNSRLFKQATASLGNLIAERFFYCDAIVTIANGANRLAIPVAKHASDHLGHEVCAYQSFKSHNSDGFGISKGNIHLRNKQIVVVDDVFSYGTNASTVAELCDKWSKIHDAIGSVLGIATIFNRNPDGLDTVRISSHNEGESLDIPVVSLVKYPIATVEQDKSLSILYDNM
jgi:orotate phosphoribosyltransferase